MWRGDRRGIGVAAYAARGGSALAGRGRCAVSKGVDRGRHGMDGTAFAGRGRWRQPWQAVCEASAGCQALTMASGRTAGAALRLLQANNGLVGQERRPDHRSVKPQSGTDSVFTVPGIFAPGAPCNARTTRSSAPPGSQGDGTDRTWREAREPYNALARARPLKTKMCACMRGSRAPASA